MHKEFSQIQGFKDFCFEGNGDESDDRHSFQNGDGDKQLTYDIGYIWTTEKNSSNGYLSFAEWNVFNRNIITSPIVIIEIAALCLEEANA